MSVKRLQRLLVRVMAALVAVAVLACGGLYLYRSFFGYQYDSSLFGKDLASGIKADENITNIALLGLDTREGDAKSHSDCMMILTVDNTRGKIKLTSLMRDSRVTIDGYGRDKLNAAYFNGGPSLAIKTINENFGTDITDYIAVDFGQLVEIIDGLEGVTVNVQDYEVDELNRVIADYANERKIDYKKRVKAAGEQTLDGVQALCYGRIRKNGTGDDWGRVERQSIVMQAMFAKVQKLSASRLLGLMQKLMPYVTTSLSPDKVAPLIVGAVKNGVPALEHTRVPQDGAWKYSGTAGEYIEYDLDKAAAVIREYIYNDVFPGDTSGAHSAVSPEGGEGPLGGVDYDEPPTQPAGTGEGEGEGEDKPGQSTTHEDPASLAEEGGSYDPETGDYQDSDGDYYRLDENGNRLYYDQEKYKAGLYE